MTGLEKAGIAMLLSSAAGTAQNSTPGNWVQANWPILCAVVAIAVAWGALTQRMKSVEAAQERLAKAQDKLATKESVDTLSGHVKELVAMWDRRHA